MQEMATADQKYVSFAIAESEGVAPNGLQ